MKCKRVISAVVCLAVVAGCTACTGPSKKDIQAIEDTIEEYGDALRDADAEALLETTNWDDDDKEYLEVESLLQFDTQGDYAVKYYEGVADTITIDYDSDDIEIKDGKATIKVTYEIIDWEEVLDIIFMNNGGQIKDAFEEVEDTVKIKGKITLVKDGKEWKITKVTGLDEVFAFIDLKEIQDPDIKPTEPLPTDVDVTPTPTSTPTPAPTAPAVSYADVIKAAIQVLYEDQELIEDVEYAFDMNSTNVYDLNQDGYPELLYLAADSYMDGEAFDADLYLWTYVPSAGKYMCVLMQRDIIYMAADGGSFIVFTTDKEIVITYSGGEESDYHTDTLVYDFDFCGVAHYRRDERLEYEPITQTYLYTYDYHEYDNETNVNDKEITENEYYSAVSGYIDNAKYVVASNYTPQTNEIEYGLIAVPEFPMMYCYEAIEYLESSVEN
ncbi:MAG: hypothetical protein IIY21_20080 [Clostridiales bacterium]|nr:hypothetical protein [Clostridiales bacterium]